jgi:hypothetical protein
MTPGLFDVFTVHCFTCPHTVSDVTPQGAHDRMEDHYRRDHAALIARLIGYYWPPPRLFPRFR